MRRLTTSLIVLAALLVPVVATAAYPTPTKLHVQVMLLTSSIWGETDPGQLVDVTLRNAAGEVVATARALADATNGDFNAQLTLDVFGRSIEAGDTLEIMLGGDPAQVYSTVCSIIAVTGVDLRRGVISGRVTPRQRTVHSQSYGMRIVPSPDPSEVAEIIEVFWRTPFTGKRTDADGTFELRPLLTDGSWVFNCGRNDYYAIYYQTSPVPSDPVNFSFLVFDQANIPGIYTGIIGGNLAMVTGPILGSYRGRLLSPAGKVKGTGACTIYNFGALEFRKRNGDPAVIAGGDTVRLSGPLGFSSTVPRLRVLFDTGANEVTIIGPRRSFVMVNFDLYDSFGDDAPSPPEAWVETDANGRAVISLAGSPYTLHEGDRVTLTHMDRTGNIWVTQQQALPPAP